MRQRCAIAALLALALLSQGAPAQSRLPPGVDGPGAGMATRSVSQYLALERSLIESLKNANRPAVLQLLGESFDLRSASTSEALSGADWLDAELRSPLQAGAVRDMAVREFGEVAVVSFLLDQRRVVQGKRQASTLYVIDVWRGQRLEARHVSRVGNGAPIPARPSGRE